jgi:nitroimidazol reductase NimA-like FMN-containing flavoprotein (pyridoxamine 5'-phosphate oxidase superfamily)
MLGELNQAQIDQVLRAEVIGRIGCCGDGRTYVVPVTYVYDGTAIYGHSGDGMKVRMMRANPSVCFEVDHVENMANWQSVISWGTFEELTGEAAGRAMRLLVDRLRPLITSATSQPTHGRNESLERQAGTAGQHAIVYRIELMERTGRFEKRGA